ncbi:hypothetical protein [Planotetraspora phitsanulokensis]|nr:hypothetical protein [Planotetraspora phitsanulokensis]
MAISTINNIEFSAADERERPAPEAAAPLPRTPTGERSPIRAG